MPKGETSRSKAPGESQLSYLRKALTRTLAHMPQYPESAQSQPEYVNQNYREAEYRKRERSK